VRVACKEKGWSGIDLLIIGGDFQAVRNSQDLNGMSVPVKYRTIGDFHEYYSGVRQAPYLTLFVGGNHEASNYLFELFYGGWVAPNIYYLGAANVLRLGPLRISGLSGIWKGYNYRKPHYERLPYNQDDVKSAYHVREIDVRKLLQIRTQVDIGLSHDWPQGVEWCGNWNALFKAKNLFEQDARTGKLGSIAAKKVMCRLRPRYWFSAHLHVKFSAIVDHETGQAMEQLVGNGTAIKQTLSPPVVAANSDEIDIDLDDLDKPEKNESIANTKPEPAKSKSIEVTEELRAQLPDSFKAPTARESLPFPEAIKNTKTNFLALDKCLPGRKFLQLLEIEPLNANADKSYSRPLKFEYDEEWLAITRTFANDLVVGDSNAQTPKDKGEVEYQQQIETETQWIRENVVAGEKMSVPENFQLTAPIYDSAVGITTREQPIEYTNSQTKEFCSLLQIPNPFDISDEKRQQRLMQGPAPNSDRGSHRGGRGGNRWNSGRGRGRGRGRTRY
jgi:lariat debranching enzyme